MGPPGARGKMPQLPPPPPPPLWAALTTVVTITVQDEYLLQIISNVIKYTRWQ